MISDAWVEVECDREGCDSRERINLPKGCRDTYIARQCTIEQALINVGWVVDDDHQYCCEDCAHPEQEHST
jgi:hypothetical protein